MEDSVLETKVYLLPKVELTDEMYVKEKQRFKEFLKRIPDLENIDFLMHKGFFFYYDSRDRKIFRFYSVEI
jgi:hypothetical protein